MHRQMKQQWREVVSYCFENIFSLKNTSFIYEDELKKCTSRINMLVGRKYEKEHTCDLRDVITKGLLSSDRWYMSTSDSDRALAYVNFWSSGSMSLFI